MQEPGKQPQEVTSPEAPDKPSPYPDGHFYSPIVDTAELLDRKRVIWPDHPPALLGIDLNESSHERILAEWFPRYMPDYDYPETLDAECDKTQFHTQNSQFSWLDARTLFVILRKTKPSRMIEVGSGFSSLLSADVNHRFHNDHCHFLCIEPYPRAFLLDGVPGMSDLIVEKVQDVPLEEFDKLQDGDILFIDSSHVSKTASDVNFLYFEVLPRLKSGVWVHVHDIFLPFEYPMEWVLEDKRSWNEQYLLRALLMYSKAFQVEFGCMYAQRAFPGLVEAGLGLAPGRGFGGGSFWISRR